MNKQLKLTNMDLFAQLGDHINETGENSTLDSPNFQWTLKNSLICFLIISLATLGLVGNLLSCIVIKLYLLRLSGTYVLFLFLSIADSLVVIILSIEAILNSFQLNYFSISPVQCKCYRFFWYFTLQLSAWIIVTLSVERYITLRLYHVLRDREMILRRAWLTGFVIVLCVAVVNIHLLFTTGIQTVDSIKFTCGYITKHPELTKHIVNSIQILFGWGLPYIITFFFNMALIVHTWKCSRPSHIRTTMVLLTVSFAFIFLTLPYTIHVVMIQHVSPDLSSVGQMQTMEATDDIVRYLLFVNNSFNFVFYTSGRQFRRALRHLFWGTNRGRRSSVTRSSFTLSTKEEIIDSEFPIFKQDAHPTRKISLFLDRPPTLS